jgi:hypothetical protein
MKQANESVLATDKKANKVTNVINVSKRGISVGAKAPNEDPKKEATKKAPLYLKEGIKGKQLVSSKIDTNNEHKKDAKSISYCIKRLLQFDANFLQSFANYKSEDINPKNLLPLLKETEGQKGFSVWLVMQLVTRYYKNM